MKTRNSQIDLQAQHLSAGLDPSDLQYLETPQRIAKTFNSAPTYISGVCIDP
jgi:hypothetical protein